MPGVDVAIDKDGDNWSYPSYIFGKFTIHVGSNEPRSTWQHEYRHYLQFKQMNRFSYTAFVAIPSVLNVYFGSSDPKALDYNHGR
jgi:hypothetical protein